MVFMHIIQLVIRIRIISRLTIVITIMVEKDVIMQGKKLLIFHIPHTKIILYFTDNVAEVMIH